MSKIKQLLGSDTLRKMFPKVNDNFNNQQEEIDNKVDKTEFNQKVTKIDNELNDKQQQLDSQDTRINNIAGQTGTSNTEIVDARFSTPKNKTFSTLKSRLDDGDIDLLSLEENLINLADSVTSLSGDVTSVTNTLESHMADYANKFVDNAGAHNSIYRGKYLGSSLTAAQQTAISSGTFEDLYIGDYWTIGGVNYRIAGFNYFRNVGDTALTANHVTIVLDTILYTARMNPTNITTGGYVNSEMRTANLAAAITTIEAAFPGRVVSHRQLLTNATSDGKASGWAWFDSKVELMNEVMVYGSVAWGESTIGGSGHNVASSNGRLPLFTLRQDMVNTRQSYWLRDVVSADRFAFVHAAGFARYYPASSSLGVRPAFSIS